VALIIVSTFIYLGDVIRVALPKAYIYKLLRHYRKHRTLEALPRGGGAVLKLKQEHLPILNSIVEEFPDAILEDLRDLMETGGF
jgi:hypothetical protein